MFHRMVLCVRGDQEALILQILVRCSMHKNENLKFPLKPHFAWFIVQLSNRSILTTPHNLAAESTAMADGPFLSSSITPCGQRCKEEPRVISINKIATMIYVKRISLGAYIWALAGDAPRGNILTSYCGECFSFFKGYVRDIIYRFVCVQGHLKPLPSSWNINLVCDVSCATRKSKVISINSSE